METSEENKGVPSEEVKAGQVPCWLNKDFVEEALRKKEPDVRLESCEVREATKLGDNYSTVVYRAIATLDDGQERKIIFKCLPSNEMRRKFANSMGVFTKEINVYEVLLPIYERMHREKIDSKGALPWPKCYQTLHDGVRDFIALEDLEPLGFKMGDRKTGLSEKELRLALKSLGQFHAYSIVYRLEDPESFKADVKDKFYENFFTEEALEGIKSFFFGCLQAMQSLLRSWKQSKYDSVADQIHDLEDIFLAKLSSTALAKDEETSVICHGDFWVNNFLFRYEEEPREFRFLDFQMVRHASPALDLLYLMATSTNTEIRRKYWKPFLKDVYLTSLWDTLEKLGHRNQTKACPFSWEWLQKELASKEFFAFAISSTTIAVLADPEDVFDMDNMTEESINDINPLIKLSRGKSFQERFKGLIDDFIESGFFH